MFEWINKTTVFLCFRNITCRFYNNNESLSKWFDLKQIKTWMNDLIPTMYVLHRRFNLIVKVSTYLVFMFSLIKKVKIDVIIITFLIYVKVKDNL